MLQALPLTDDLEEADAVYGALCSLTFNERFMSMIQGSLAALLRAFGEVITQQGISQTVAGNVAQTLHMLIKKYGDQLLTSLSTDQRSALDDLTNRVRS